MIERISSPGTPPPQGPYSPAVKAGDYVYVSGQIPLDPATGQLAPGGIGPETRQVLTNIQRILEGAGASMSQVVRCGVFLVDAADFKPMNAVYTEFFGEVKPARTTIIVAALPMPNARVEIDAVAYVGK
jgi:2-iminobutanoate/2-iminopropanoate deaminase